MNSFYSKFFGAEKQQQRVSTEKKRLSSSSKLPYERFKEIYYKSLEELDNCQDKQFREDTRGLRRLLEYLWEQNECLRKLKDESLGQCRILQRQVDQLTALNQFAPNNVNKDVGALTKVIEDMADGNDIDPETVSLATESDRVPQAVKRYMKRSRRGILVPGINDEEDEHPVVAPSENTLGSLPDDTIAPRTSLSNHVEVPKLSTDTLSHRTTLQNLDELPKLTNDVLSSKTTVSNLGEVPNLSHDTLSRQTTLSNEGPKLSRHTLSSETTLSNPGEVPDMSHRTLSRQTTLSNPDEVSKLSHDGVRKTPRKIALADKSAQTVKKTSSRKEIVHHCMVKTNWKEGQMEQATVAEEESTRGKLASLKKALHFGMQEINAQEEANRILSSHLVETKKDIAALASNGPDLEMPTRLAPTISYQQSFDGTISTTDDYQQLVAIKGESVQPHLELPLMSGGGDAMNAMRVVVPTNACHEAVPLLNQMKGDLVALKQLSSMHCSTISNGGDDVLHTRWHKMEEELYEVEIYVKHLLERSNCACVFENNKQQLMAEINEKEATIWRLTKEIRDVREANNGHDKPGQIEIWIEDNLKPVLDITGAIVNELGNCDKDIVDSNNVVYVIKKRLLFLRNVISSLPMLKDKLEDHEKMVSFKDENLQQLHTTLEMRERHIDELNYKVQQLEKQLEEQLQVIADLQLAVQNCKKFEVKPKEDELCSLKFELCELELKRNIVEKEKVAALECVNREKLALQNQVTHLDLELRTLEPVLCKTQTKALQFEEISLKLRRELEERDCEIHKLQKEVSYLEKELKSEVERSEERALQDSVIIANLRDKVEKLQNQSQALWQQHNNIVAVADAKLKDERSRLAHKFSTAIMQLQYENFRLNEHLTSSKGQEQIISKVDTLECLLRQGEQRQVSQLEQIVKESQERFNVERNQLLMDLSAAEKDIMKKEEIVVKLKGSLQNKEEELTRTAQKCTALQAEKIQLEDLMRKKSSEWEKDAAELTELEAIAKRIDGQRIELARRCATLNQELRTREQIIHTLETKMAVSNEKVAELTDKCCSLTNRFEIAEGNERRLRNTLVSLQEEGLSQLNKQEESRRSAEKELALIKGEKEDLRCSLVQAELKLAAMDKLKKEHDELNAAHTKLVEDLKLSGKRKNNIEKLLLTAEEELKSTYENKVALETELCQLKDEMGLLQEKLANQKRTSEKQVRKLTQENQVLSERTQAIQNKLEKALANIHTYESEVIPELHSSLDSHQRLIEALKSEVDNASESCQRMQKGALSLLNITRQHVNDLKRNASGRDVKIPEDQLQVIATASELLLSEIQRDGKFHNRKCFERTEDRNSHSPGPGCNVWGKTGTRQSTGLWAKTTSSKPYSELRGSAECFPESGFQSMIQSPTPELSDYNYYQNY